MVVSSAYAQYPVVKKIGKDSVVLITVKQAEDINVEFDRLRDSLRITSEKKDSLHKDIQSIYGKYQEELYYRNRAKTEADSIKILYMANKKIYESEIRKQTVTARTSAILSAIMALLLMFVSSL